MNKLPEDSLKQVFAEHFKNLGFDVATEVANIYRSADLVVVDEDKKITIIECKISNVRKAVEQIQIHKLSADRVFIGMPFRNPRESTISMIKNACAGLLYLMPDGTVEEYISAPQLNDWLEKTKNRLLDNMNYRGA